MSTELRPRRGLSHWLALAIVFAVLLGSLATRGASSANANVAAPAPLCATGTTIATTAGSICGSSYPGGHEWKGIAYAAAPVASLRWMPPQSPKPFAGVRPATSFGSECVQPDGTGSEDCLDLNVTAPSTASAASKLPVIVQLHPGGFISGNGNGNYEALAGKRTVVVSLNYRLGVFGFLANTMLGTHPGDYGLLDQQAALRWVKKNIAQFGGNPHLVTLMGESAGGSSVCHQLTSPTSTGLFQRAISYSGDYNPVSGRATGQAFPLQLETQDCKSALPSAATAERAGRSFAAAAKCATATCLRALPVSTALRVAGSGFQYSGGQGTTAPTLNATILPYSFQAAVRKNALHKVPVMIGVARDENLSGAPTTATAYASLVDAQYGKDAAAILRRYPARNYVSPFLAWRTLVADSNTVCPALRIDAGLAKKTRTYAFIMDASDASPAAFTPAGQANGSYHVADWFLFSDAGLPAPTTPNEKVLQQQELASVAAFAAHGNPNTAVVPEWPAYRTSSDVMSLQPGDDTELTTHAHLSAAHRCTFWTHLYPRS